MVAQEDVYNSVDAHILIWKQPAGECPTKESWVYGETGVAVPTNIGVDGHNLLVVDSTLNAPYTSFATLIVADPNLEGFVVNRDTGQLVYFDGTQADATDFIDGQIFGIGMMKSGKIVYSRVSKQINEIGTMHAGALKAGIEEITFSLEKVYIDKQSAEPGSFAHETRGVDLLSMLGIALVDTDGDKQVTVPQNYYFIAIYIVDSGGDETVKGKLIVMPCSMIDEVSPGVDLGDEIMCSISGKATYVRHFPPDSRKIQSYPVTFVVPP